MPLINCKVDHSLEWYTNCITIIGGNDATFVIRNTQLYVPVVTLKTEDNAKLSKLLNEGFKRSVYWNKYKVILKDYADNNAIRDGLMLLFKELIDCLFLVMHVVIMLLIKIHIENISFQDLK